MKRTLTFACAAIAAAALTSTANAEIFDNRLNVKVGIAGVLPNEDDNAGLNIDITDEAVPTLQLEYFLTDAVSVELLCCVAPHDISAPALGDVAEVTLFPPTVTVKYRPITTGPLQPYAGVGLNYTVFFDEDPSLAGLDSIDLDDSFGGALQAGVDYQLNDRWSLNFDVRRIWIQTDATLNFAGAATPTEIEVDIDPWVVSASVGYRF